jgi:acyl carrier protein phosphodiesterase
MTYRARRPRLLDDAARMLGAAHDGLQADFDHFFPELLAHVEAG